MTNVVITMAAMGKMGVAKIVAWPKYGVNGNNPINILKKTNLVVTGGSSNWSRWLSETDYVWKKNNDKLSGKKISNKNIIIAGFLSASIDIYALQVGKNFPIFDSAENVYFVENGSIFMDKIIQHHKLLFPTNPTVHVVDVGIACLPIPSTSIKAKIDTLKVPLLWMEHELVSTQHIIDHINNDYFEERIEVRQE